MLIIYRIVIRLKSHVLRKGDSRLVADRQMQTVFCSCSMTLEHWTDTLTTWATRVVQSHHHIFSLCWTILGTSLKKLCFMPRQWRSLGHWPRAIYLFDRQTHRQTDKQVGRHHIYSVVLKLTYLISLSVDGLSPYCQWTVYVYFKCLTSLKRTIPNISYSLRQSIVCKYDNAAFCVCVGGAWYAS